jgi:hypothetical protein
MNDKLRKEVRERDNHECRFCESDDNLHTHHIVPRSADGSDDLENLITVCASCHKTIENTQGDALKRIKKQKQEKLNQLQNESENSYTLNELSDAFENLYPRGNFYLVATKGLISERRNFLYVGPSREKALDEMEKHENAEMLKWRIKVPVCQVLEDYKMRIEEEVDKIR